MLVARIVVLMRPVLGLLFWLPHPPSLFKNSMPFAPSAPARCLLGGNSGRDTPFKTYCMTKLGKAKSRCLGRAWVFLYRM